MGSPVKKGPDKRYFIARNLRGVRGKRKKGEKLAERWRLAFTFANNQNYSLFLLFRACHAGYIMHNRAFNSILLSTALTSRTPSPRKKNIPVIHYIVQYDTLHNMLHKNNANLPPKLGQNGQNENEPFFG